jgi:hypothetical protein
VALPDDVVELLIERAKLYATQAFLMENIKAKTTMLDIWKHAHADISDVTVSDKPKFSDFVMKYGGEELPVTEEYGWEQLSPSELNEYYEVEAYAAHIGQFIHHDGILDRLRKELPNTPSIDWIEIESGKKSPVYIKTHHTAKGLHDYHEKLASLHRKYEQRVNYFKAKVKNIVTLENARIAKHNADRQNNIKTDFDTAIEKYNVEKEKALQEIKTIRDNFEMERQKNIQEIANMRINVDPRFQDVVDLFLNQLSDK